MKVILIGGGGHAKVVADILLGDPNMEPVGYTSLEPGGDLLGLPRLGGDSVPGVERGGVVVAIGDNETRKKVFEECERRGETLVSAIHPSVIIGRDVTIEPGCMICAGVVINSGAVIRRNTILNTGCTVDHDCVVGPHAHVAPGVNLAGNVTVGEGAFLGIGSCVVQGITVGPWSTVGAGGAVIRNIKPGDIAVGVPARRLPNPEF